MKRGFHLNLVSLADIVTNAIGMLVLFTLITVLHSRPQGSVSLQPPIEYETSHSPVFFLCKGDAILYLDPTALAGSLLPGLESIEAEREARCQTAPPPCSQSPDPAPISIPKLGLDVRLDSIGRLRLEQVHTAAWEPAATLDNPKSHVRQMMAQIDPTLQFAYFFVADSPTAHSSAGSGFAVLEHASALLHAQGIATGWSPFDDQHPPLLCFYNNCRYRPSQGPQAAKSGGGPHGR